MTIDQLATNAVACIDCGARPRGSFSKRCIECTTTGKPVRHSSDSPTTDGWTEEELELLNRHQAGQTVVANLRTHKQLIAWAEEEGVHVRIDRKTVWGNPFKLGPDGDRNTVIAAYRDEHLPAHPELTDDIAALKGKVLGCRCHPEPCHGDVLAEEANR